MFHVGSARSALQNWIYAQQHQGAFVLRIEDTDAARNRPEGTEGINSALGWLGSGAGRAGGRPGARPPSRPPRPPPPPPRPASTARAGRTTATAPAMRSS